MRLLISLFCYFLLNNSALKAQEPVLMVPTGHTGVINSITFSPDEKRILTSSADGTTKLWDAHSGRLLADMKGHTRAVLRSVFSPKNSFIATISFDRSALLWNAGSAKLLHKLNGHEAPVRSVVFSASEDLLATSDDSVVVIWNTNNGAVMHTLKKTEQKISTIAFSPDGNYVVVGADGLRLYDIRSGDLVAHHVPYTTIKKFRYSPDGKKIAFSTGSRLTILDPNSGERIDENEGEEEYKGNNLQYSPDGKYLICGAGTKYVKMWAADSLKMVREFARSEKYFISAVFSPDGKYIISSSSDSSIRIWETDPGTLVTTTVSTNGVPKNAYLTRDNKQLLVAEFEKAYLFDLVRNTETIEFKANTVGVNYASFSLDNKLMVLACSDGTIRLSDGNTGKLLSTITGHKKSTNKANISADSKKVVSVSDDTTVKVWDLEKSSLLFTLQNNKRLSGTAIFSPDGKYIASGDADTAMRIWNAATGSFIKTLRGHISPLTSIYFSPDGNKILSTSFDGLAKLWDIKTGKVVSTLPHASSVRVGVFSPDGRSVATLTSRDSVFIWNIAGKKLTSFYSPSHAVEYSHDGNTLYCYTKNQSVEMRTVGAWELKTTITLGSNYTPIAITKERILGIQQGEVGVFNSKGDKLYSRYETTTGNLIRIPSGYYYSSRYVSQLLHFVTNDLRLITFQQLDIRYNRPDLVLQAIGNRDSALIGSYRNAYYKRIRKLGLDTAVFAKEQTLPTTKLTVGAHEQKMKEVSITVHAEDNASQLERFNVWVNDVPLFGMTGISLRNRNMKSFDTTFNIILSNGANIIESSVSNAGGLESYRMPTYVLHTPSVDVKETIYFVGIGIDQFRQEGQDLNWSVKDVRDLSIALKKKYGDHIIIDTLFNKDVSIENVVALKKRLQSSSVNDKVILSYSGHGLLSKEFDYYLSTYSVDFDNPERNGLPYEVLEGLLDGIPARKKLMLIDACHSGELDKEELEKYTLVEKVLDDSGTKSGRKPVLKDGKLGMKNSFELMQELFVNVGRSTGATIISAAGGMQFAQEQGSLQNGVFTYSILEYMKTHPTATVSDLREYVNKRVSELTQGMQVPTTRSETNGADWSIW